MIQPQSYLNVADNTGAKQLMCIRVLGSSSAKIGDTIIAVVKEALPNMPVKKSEVVTAVVVTVLRLLSFTMNFRPQVMLLFLLLLLWT